jgi:hypothetical protein
MALVFEYLPTILPLGSIYDFEGTHRGGDLEGIANGQIAC